MLVVKLITASQHRQHEERRELELSAANARPAAASNNNPGRQTAASEHDRGKQ